MVPLSFIYKTFIQNKKKERFEIILEPLQAILQLALLSSTPIDTKINIYNNILYIQTPTWKQSISRTYYNDSKSDLFFLFSAITRFNKFYSYLVSINNSDTNLFLILKELAIKGIDNLLQTYKQIDNPALLHTLQIYKTILNSPEHRAEHRAELSAEHRAELSAENIFELSGNLINFDILGGSDTENSTTQTMDIDSVFINIRNLYSSNELFILFNTLLLLRRHPNNYLDYINGLNYILEPINKQIKGWIADNIVY